jgi:hypothetical protein
MPVLEKTVYETLDTGVYPATIRDIQITDGKFGSQLQWDFDLVDGGSQRGWTGANMSAKSKCGKWIAAILGTIPDELDTEDLVGKPVRLSLTIKTTDDGSEFNRVDAVLAPRVVKAKVKPEPQQEDDSEVPF